MMRLHASFWYARARVSERAASGWKKRNELIAPDWLWIPITIGAALAQTARNAAQRHLTPVLGTLGATLVRFFYGLPFALLWLFAVAIVGGFPLPAPNTPFVWWVLVSSIAQIAATALLLRVMAERNFALGTAYAKTEV